MLYSSQPSRSKYTLTKNISAIVYTFGLVRVLMTRSQTSTRMLTEGLGFPCMCEKLVDSVSSEVRAGYVPPLGSGASVIVFLAVPSTVLLVAAPIVVVVVVVVDRALRAAVIVVIGLHRDAVPQVGNVAGQRRRHWNPRRGVEQPPATELVAPGRRRPDGREVAERTARPQMRNHRVAELSGQEFTTQQLSSLFVPGCLIASAME